jgi:alpha-L-rhamnosidase
VQVWDRAGRRGPWSEPASFGTGLLEPGDWQALWVARGPVLESNRDQQSLHPDGQSSLLRKEYNFARPVRAARVFVTAPGFYELRINGRKAGDFVLTPSKTNYHQQLLYDAYEVKDLLHIGANVLGIMLGNGWYNPSRKWWAWQMPWYGSPRAILQLHIEYEDGGKDLFCTDESWRTFPGPVVSSCIYDGETYDARLWQDGWDRPGFDDSTWPMVCPAAAPGGTMRFQAIEPIKVTDHIKPVAVHTPRPGVHVFDMGQNFAGWVRLRVHGPRGTKVTLRFAENIHRDHSLNDFTNKGALQTDIYILRGDDEEVWEPRFTYHGFRYVEITGYPGEPDAQAVLGCVIRSSCARTGEFICSRDLINHVHHCTVWSQMSNMMGNPTDDCQRPERLGWLGDAHVVCEEAICNFSMARFYRKWLRDIASQQHPSTGNLPHIAPTIGCNGSPCWSSAYLLVPWYCYRAYGDIRFLADHYEGMKRYVDYLLTTASDYILPRDRYGDHLAAHRHWKGGDPEQASTWYFYYDALLVAEAARALREQRDAEHYTELARKIHAAFQRRFFIPETIHYHDNTQCVNAMVLYLNLADEMVRERILDRLLYDIVSVRNERLSTGILGTKYLMEVLDRSGHSDLAWRLATRDEYPSWGDMSRGQTTLSELWDRTGSNNHVMFGSVDSWFYGTLGGICLDESKPSAERLCIAPFFVAELSHCRAVRRCPQGSIRSEWWKEAGQITWETEVPANLTARLRIPRVNIIHETGQMVWDNSPAPAVAGIHAVRGLEKTIECLIGSGTYRFTWNNLDVT